MRIALGQINATVGDLESNVAKMIEWTARASEAAADLVCFPELAVTGYPPEDLVLRPEFVEDNLDALQRLARETAGGCAVLTGFAESRASNPTFHPARQAAPRMAGSSEAVIRDAQPPMLWPTSATLLGSTLW